MNPIDTLKAGTAGIAENFTGENPKLFAETVKLIQGMPDGFLGLKKQFQDNGLGTLVQSLTGEGPTATVLPDQILKGFGKDKIEELAGAAGLDPEVVPEKLAGILPTVFDQFMPKVNAAV